MKTLKLTIVLSILALGFYSCASDEDALLLAEESATALLKEYEIGKNSDGSYFIDYQVDGASSDNIKDKNGSVHNIMLSNDKSSQDKMFTEDLGLVGDKGELKVNFKDTQKNQVTSVRVKDDNILLARNDNELLETFTFRNKGDGSFDLDYKVKDNVVSRVEYNTELGVYDVILEKGKSKQSEFLHTFTPENDNFEVHFVTIRKNARVVATRKPIIDPDGNQGG